MRGHETVCRVSEKIQICVRRRRRGLDCTSNTQNFDINLTENKQFGVILLVRLYSHYRTFDLTYEPSFLLKVTLLPFENSSCFPLEFDENDDTVTQKCFHYVNCRL